MQYARFVSGVLCQANLLRENFGKSNMSDSSSKVFISYRRGPSSSTAGRVYDRLVQQIPANQIFMDVDAVEPGEDFRQAIDKAIGDSAVCLVIVGEGWLEATEPRTGERRLNLPNDFVRLEIEAALKQGTRVIPVLVGDASMPSEVDLPESIKTFAWKQAVQVRHTRFDDDVYSLIDAAMKIVAPDKARRSNTKAELTRKLNGDQKIKPDRFHWSSALIFFIIVLFFIYVIGTPILDILTSMITHDVAIFILYGLIAICSIAGTYFYNHFVGRRMIELDRKKNYRFHWSSILAFLLIIFIMIEILGYFIISTLSFILPYNISASILYIFAAVCAILETRHYNRFIREYLSQ